VFRIVWVYTVFPVFKNLESIHISYPLSWAVTGAVFFAILIFMFRRMPKEEAAEEEGASLA
jgi:Na+-driven multidrug efflux pump